MNRYNSSICKQLQKLCITSIRRKSSNQWEPSTSQKFDFSLSKDVENDILQNKYKVRHHPGVMNISVVKLPDTLYKAVCAIKEEKGYQDKQLSEDSFKLSSYIFKRQPPFEEGEVKQLTESVVLKLINKGKLSPKFKEQGLSIEDITKAEKDKIQTSLKKHTYNWHPITYDEYKSFTYLWSRLAPDYAALVRIFTEIQKRRPNFSPRFLFDFGSGVGSVMWAAECIWPNTIQEVYNVDSSGHMNALSERLFSSGVQDNIFNSHKNSTYYRQYLPTSEGIKYDIVVSSRSLFEVGNIGTRARTIDILWRKVAPGGFLVVVESGTIYGYTLMMEIRDYLHEITKIEREKYNYNSPIHVFSPCPHDNPCPRFYHRSNKPCYFSVAYHPILNFNLNVDKYSFIVLQKEVRNENEKSWPRIVQPVLRRHKHVITRTCTPAGAIREFVATKNKHSSTCYMVCKKCMWGDILPIDIHKDTIDNSENVQEINEFSSEESDKVFPENEMKA